MTLVNHEPGPSTTRSAFMIASTACRVAGGSLGSSRTRRTLPGVVAIATCPRITRLIRGSDSRPATSASICKRDRAHRQYPALDAEDAAQLVKCRNGIGEHLVEPGQQQVADRMAGQCAAAAEPVLKDGRPQPPVRAVGCQGRQRHSQITRRHHIEFAAQPSRRSAVVGNRYHGGDMRSEPAGGRQRGVEPVAAAQRDDARAHSRPRSRCSTRTVSWSPPCSRPASASAIATLRCLPPVQPMATVM